MSHTIRDKAKLLNRVRRIAGQVRAIEQGLAGEQDASDILRTIAACRGAINSLMAEVIEGHVRLHVVDSRRPLPADQADAVEELLDVVRAYLK